jgi:hypothetical protein
VARIGSVFHQLNGNSLYYELKLRECYKGMIQDKNLPINYRGMLTHMYGDTFGHLNYTKPGSKGGAFHGVDVTGQGVENIGYDPTIGHGGNLTWPDQVALRPELAKEYISALYSTLGASSSGSQAAILKAIDSLAQEGADTDRSIELLHAISLAWDKSGYLLNQRGDYLPDSGRYTDSTEKPWWDPSKYNFVKDFLKETKWQGGGNIKEEKMTRDESIAFMNKVENGCCLLKKENTRVDEP